MFLGPLVLEADPAPDMWIFTAPLVWQDKQFGTLTVPIGFRTDLASIPYAFRSIPFLDTAGISRRPAGMHDWLYSWRMIGKDDADEFLKQSLLAEGAEPKVAAVFYLGVHEFGQAAWDSDNGALETRDFDTVEHFRQWKATLSPTFSTTVPGVL
jgi:hypothetical protein